MGANTVKGPGPFKVSTRPAAFTAATNVVRFFAFDAFSGIFIFDIIGAPPTVTVVCPKTGLAIPIALVTNNESIKVFIGSFMIFLRFAANSIGCRREEYTAGRYLDALALEYAW